MLLFNWEGRCEVKNKISLKWSDSLLQPPSSRDWQRRVRIRRLLGSYVVSTMQEKHGESRPRWTWFLVSPSARRVPRASYTRVHTDGIIYLRNAPRDKNDRIICVYVAYRHLIHISWTVVCEKVMNWSGPYQKRP